MLTAEAITELKHHIDAKAEPFHTPRGGEAVVVPDGYQVHEFPPLEPVLTHIKQRVTLHDQQSFIDYVNAYKTERTRIFAEPGFMGKPGELQQARVVAVLDYHDQAKPRPAPEDAADMAAEGMMSGQPRYAAHVATYAPRYSEQWVRWHDNCRVAQLSQFAFAEMIEECRADIKEPAGGVLLDMIRTFKANRKVEFDSVTYQRDGSSKLHYSDTVDKQGSTDMPEKLTLAIPVYYRAKEALLLDVFIRYKLGEKNVSFALKLDRADRVEDHAFEVLAGKIAEHTNVPLHMGRLA